MFSKWSSYFFGSDAVVVADKPEEETREEQQQEQQQQEPVAAAIVKRPKKKDNQQQQQHKKKKNGALSKKSAAKNSKTGATAAGTSAIVEQKTPLRVSGEASSSGYDDDDDEEDWILLADVTDVTDTGSAFEMSDSAAGSEAAAVGAAAAAAPEDDEAVVVQEEREEMVVLDAEKDEVDVGDDDGDGEEASIVDMAEMYKDDVEDPELISLDAAEAAEAADAADDSWCVAPVAVAPARSSRFIPSKQLEMEAFTLPPFSSRIGTGDAAANMSFYNTNFVFFKNSDFKENCEPRPITAVAAASETELPPVLKEEAVAAGASAAAPAAAAASPALAKPTKPAKKRNRYLNVVIPPTQLVPNTNRIDRFDLINYECGDLMTNPMKDLLKLPSAQHRSNKRSKARALAHCKTRRIELRTERYTHFLMYND